MLHLLPHAMLSGQGTTLFLLLINHMETFYVSSDNRQYYHGTLRTGSISLKQCCGSGMLILDPGSVDPDFFPDPGPRIPDPTKTPKKGVGKNVFITFYL